MALRPFKGRGCPNKGFFGPFCEGSVLLWYRAGAKMAGWRSYLDKRTIRRQSLNKAYEKTVSIG